MSSEKHDGRCFWRNIKVKNTDLCDYYEPVDRRRKTSCKNCANFVSKDKDKDKSKGKSNK